MECHSFPHGNVIVALSSFVSLRSRHCIKVAIPICMEEEGDATVSDRIGDESGCDFACSDIHDFKEEMLARATTMVLTKGR